MRDLEQKLRAAYLTKDLNRQKEEKKQSEMRKAQAITALCAWAGFLFSLVVFVGFVLFGAPLLSLFGPHAAEGNWSNKFKM